MGATPISLATSGGPVRAVKVDLGLDTSIDLQSPEAVRRSMGPTYAARKLGASRSTGKPAATHDANPPLSARTDECPCLLMDRHAKADVASSMHVQ